MPSDRNRATASRATSDVSDALSELAPSAFVEAWEQSESLVALRELIDVAAAVPSAVAARAALSHHEFTALEHLMKGPLGPVELAKILGVTSAASSGVVDRLVARGHAGRAPHQHDGRRTVVTITESGRDEVLGYLMPMFLALREMDARLDKTERSAVTDYLKSATRSIRRLL